MVKEPEDMVFKKTSELFFGSSKLARVITNKLETNRHLWKYRYTRLTQYISFGRLYHIRELH
jgi:hypothetical protein